MFSLRPTVILLFLGLVTMQQAPAQSLFQSLKINSGDTLNIFRMQEAFDDWAKDKNLSEIRGWKNLQRKLYIESTRVNADGFYPDQRTLLEALSEIDALNAGVQARNDASWWPIGPYGPSTVMNGYGQPGIGRLNCVAFHPTDPNIIFVGAPDGGIWKSYDNGQSWAPLGDQLPVPGVSAILIDRLHPDTIYIATGDAEYSLGSSTGTITSSSGYQRGMGVYKSTDGGQNWSPTALATNPVVHDLSLLNSLIGLPDSTHHLLASGPLGIWKTVNGGANWFKTSTEPIDVLEQDPLHPNIVFAASSNTFNENTFNRPAILRSNDFGSTWVKLPIFGPGESTSRINIRVAPSNPAIVYALAANGGDSGLYGVYRSDNGGDNWTQVVSSDTLNLLGWNDGDPNGDSGGQGWYDLTLCVDPVDPYRVFVGGVNLWGSEDGGYTWALTSHWTTWGGPSAHADLHQLRYNPLTQQWYLCSDGGILRTDSLVLGDMAAIMQCFNGNGFEAGCYTFPTLWTNISDGLSITHFYKLDVFNGDDQYVLGGTQDNSHMYRDAAGEWSTVFRGDGMDCTFHATDPGIIYGASQNGNIHVSFDGGLSYNWNISDPAKDQGAGGAWVTPFEGTATLPFRVYAGFDNLWEFDQDNFEWQRISEFPDAVRAREVALCPSSPDAFAVLKTGSTAGSRQLWLTKDHGLNWNKINSNTNLFSYTYPSDICFGNSDNEIYIALAGYTNNARIYRTLDGGQTWENVTKGFPKVPVISIAFHEKSLNRTVYIGTDYGVYYTTDSLTEWVPYNEGLPRTRISDIDLNYISNKIYVASYGRGMWANDLIPAPLVGTSAPTSGTARISVMPNPVGSQGRIALDDLEPGNYSLGIYDVLGREVWQTAFEAQRTEQVFPVPENLHSGLYYAQLRRNQYTRTVSFFIER